MNLMATMRMCLGRERERDPIVISLSIWICHGDRERLRGIVRIMILSAQAPLQKKRASADGGRAAAKVMAKCSRCGALMRGRGAGYCNNEDCKLREKLRRAEGLSARRAARAHAKAKSRGPIPKKTCKPPATDGAVEPECAEEASPPEADGELSADEKDAAAMQLDAAPKRVRRGSKARPSAEWREPPTPCAPRKRPAVAEDVSAASAVMMTATGTPARSSSERPQEATFAELEDFDSGSTLALGADS